MVTGETLSKVRVRLEPLDRATNHAATSTSDSEGRFSLVDLDPGNYILWGERNGYLETSYGRGTIIQLDGRPSGALLLKLVPAAVIAGTVRDSDGEPLTGAHVVLSRRTYEYGTPRIEDFHSGDTNDLGEYRFYDLPPGKYYVGVEPKLASRNRVDHSAKRDGPREDSIATLYPGVQDVSLAVPIEVVPGARVSGIDVTLTQSRVFRVSGRVVSGGGTGIDRAIITLVRAGLGIWDSERQTITRNADGDFDLKDVAPDSYTLIAKKGDLQGRIPLMVGSEDVHNLRLALAPGAEVRGSISVEGEKKLLLAGTQIFLTTNGRSGQMERADDRGAFLVRNLTPDQYRVSYFGHGRDFYVKSMRSGDADVLKDALTISRSGVVPLEIVLSSDGGGIEGGIVDKGSPATVLLAANSGNFFKSTTANQHGRYEFKGVPPGDYKLLALAEVEPGEWHDPEFLVRWGKFAESVTVRPNGRESVTLRLR